MTTYAVRIDGFEGETVVDAATRSKARYEAWLAFSEAWDCSFANFQRISHVRRTHIDPHAGYDYVRRAYGVEVAAGQHVELVHEGPSSGKRGVVMYPGTVTAHVKVLLDGENKPVWVHPSNVKHVTPAGDQKGGER